MASVKPGPDWLSRKLSARCQQQEQKLREVLQKLWPEWQQQGGLGLTYQLQFEHFPHSLLVYVLAPADRRELLLKALPGWQLQLQQALFKKGIVLKPPLRHLSVCSEFPQLDPRSFCLLVDS
jgi:hypothetical protein